MSPTTSNNLRRRRPKETKWTDAQIRWTEDEGNPVPDQQGAEEGSYMDPFADPDPLEIFTFKFRSGVDDDDDDDDDDKNESTIELNIHGHKTTSDAVWQSTGLTLWKASKYLCDYMVLHSNELQNKRILEVRNHVVLLTRNRWLERHHNVFRFIVLIIIICYLPFPRSLFW
jgi:hypothetical protein